MREEEETGIIGNPSLNHVRSTTVIVHHLLRYKSSFFFREVIFTNMNFALSKKSEVYHKISQIVSLKCLFVATEVRYSFYE